jgi:hypothetical protein
MSGAGLKTQGSYSNGDGACRLYFSDFEGQRLQIAEHPGRRRCPKAGDGARVDEPGMAAPDVGLLPDFGFVAVAAADQIVIASASHAVADVRIVGQEDASSAKFNDGIVAMIVQQAFRMACHAGDRYRVSEIVSMHGVNWKSERERCAQRVATDDVAAVNHRFGAIADSGGDCGRHQRTAVMAVGKNAYLHDVWRAII